MIEERAERRREFSCNTLLDQLRRNTARRGVVEIEWAKPRRGQIMRHKETYQRFLVQVAQRVQKQDAEFADVKESMTKFRSTFEEQLKDLEAALPEANSLA